MPRPPDLLIAGAQKCGTTSLHQSLRHHPGVTIAVSPDTRRRVKEVHFFTNHWSKGVPWYEAHFAEDGGLALDSTPNYIASPRAHERMARVAPNARIVITLRNPIDRCFSAYNHYKQILPRSRSWDWLVPHGSFEVNVLAELQHPGDRERPSRGLVGGGDYADQIAHLLEYFPRDRVHVMILERWSARPADALDELQDFAGLERHAVPREVMHRRENRSSPMRGEIRGLLAERFASSNAKLRELLEDDIPEWEAGAPKRSRSADRLPD